MDNKKQKFKMINLMFNVPFIMLSSIALIVQKEKLSSLEQKKCNVKKDY